MPPALPRVGETPEFDRTSPVIWVQTSNGSTNPKAPKVRIDQSIRIISLSFNDGPVGSLASKGGSANAKSVNKLTLEVENFNLRNHEDFTFAVGGSLDVQWGYPGRMGPKRHACITKVTGDHKLKIECRARSILMHRETKVRNFINMTHSEVAKQIFKENGYADADMDIEDTEVRYGVINQAGLSDHQFLGQLAEEEGFEYFDDTGATGIHFRRPTFGAMPVRELRYFTPPRVGEIERFSTDGSVTSRVSSVTVNAIDTRTKQATQAVGSDATTKRGGVGKQLGSVQKEVTVVAITQTNNPAKAKRMADKMYLGSTRGSVKLKMDIIGDAQLLSKTVVKVSGITKIVDGLYYVAAIKHSIKAGHFKMALECKSDAGHTAQKTASKAKKAQGAADPGAAGVQLGTNQSERYKNTHGRATAKEVAAK